MKRGSYREAIRWLVDNDDTEWAAYGASDPSDARGTPSVTAALVADLFDTNCERVRSDILRAWRKQGREP